MSRRGSRLFRLLPAVAAAGLLALAAAAPRQAALGPAAPTWLQPGVCTDYVESAPGDSAYSFGYGGGVSQPLVSGIAVAACSVSVQAHGWTWLRLNIVDWDPLSLTPDAGTVALRTQLLDPSALQYYTLNRTPRVNFVPPIVSTSVPGVADAPRTTVAADMFASATVFPASFEGHYDPAGPGDLPIARVLGTSGARPALPGAHPVLAHAICDAGDGLQDLRVAQAVVRTDALVAAQTPKELIQRFRVPERVELRWVEFAIVPDDYSSPWYLETATVSIVDADGASVPGATLPRALTSALFRSDTDYNSTPSHWAGDWGFDHVMALEPGRDYWLHVSEARAMGFYTRVLDGSESATFTDAIGGFFTRDTSVAEWTPRPGRVLAFKIIGKPTAPVGVEPPAATAAFALTVSPNPAQTIADVRWSGAVGPVRLEVFDARGRRVARGQGGAAGSWSFARAGRGGQPLPAGVYFVHARDSAGGQAIERVVFVR